MVVGGEGISWGLGLGGKYMGHLLLCWEERGTAGPIFDHVRGAVWVSLIAWLVKP